MNMKKQLLPAFLVLGILLAGLSGCGEQTKPDTDNAQSPLETVTYANLTDGDSRALLTAALANAGVDESRVSAFFEKVDLFNRSVKSEWLTDGFESAAPTATKYDPYEMQDLWAEKNGQFPRLQLPYYGVRPVWRISHRRSGSARYAGRGRPFSGS